MIGVSAFVLILGVGSAWLVSRYEFNGRKLFDWLLMLPAACPAYLVAYAYTDFFEYAGPIQKLLRNIFGWHNAQEYWFPEIRSLGGAIFVMSFVLYPYVYVLARTSFLKSSISFYEVAKLYNKNTFIYVGLPLARPAIIAGLALVCMEVISDFGTVEFFTVETLTLGIFNVWLGMNNLVAASQIAIVAFIFVIALLFIEIKSRARRKFSDNSQRQINPDKIKLTKFKSLLSVLFCWVPIFFGFILPVLLLLLHSLKTSYHQNWTKLSKVVLDTLLIAGIGAISIIIISSLTAIIAFYKGKFFLNKITDIASTGYAFPGTMLAIGILVFVGFVDKFYALSGNFFGYQNSGFLSGTILILILAYVVRFQAVGYGSIRSGITQIPRNLSDASYVMGKPFNETIRKVILPLIKTSIIAGGLLAFVDIMKELPMTLLLRPFNFETLATYTYQFAHDELIEQASLPALLIIFAGLLPVIFMNKYLREVKV
ncbi:MAG: ABC transporter permease [SAR116 cluster bacterium]|nr:ABC transporter permease [SAR116 cluster bacterium]